MSFDKLRDLEKPPRIFLYATGAGAGIQKKIWETPGCSSFLVGCGFPYDTNETTNIIGRNVNKFISEDTAMELAMAAYMKAYAPGHSAIGIGLTASVASTKEHRGDHRIVISTFSDTECLTWGTIIPKGAGFYQRLVDGELTDNLGIAAILRAAGIKTDSVPFRSKPLLSNCDSKLLYDPAITAARSEELIMAYPFFSHSGSRGTTVNTKNVIFYPGSFNPFHFGHADGAEAIRQAGALELGEARNIVFSTTINPPHKDILTPAQMLSRAVQMKGRDFLLSSNDPLFVDKAARYPNGWFGVGADTLINMLDPKWGVPTEDVLNRLSSFDIRMFVLGRLVSGEFMTYQDIKNKIPMLNNYNKMFIEVPGRWDISSTEIRNGIHHG